MFGILSFLFGGGITEDNLPRRHVEAVLKTTAAEINSELIQPFDTVVSISNHPSPSPVLSGQTLRDGKLLCRLQVNQRDEAWANWGILLNSADKALWPALIKFSALHEVGHCVGQQDPAIRELTLKALKGSKEAVNKVESYADLFGLAMLSKFYPTEAAVVQAHLIQIRSAGPGYSGTHDTTKVLKRLNTSKPQAKEITADKASEIASALVIGQTPVLKGLPLASKQAVLYKGWR